MIVIVIALINITLCIILLLQQKKITRQHQEIHDLKSQTEDLVEPGLNIIQAASKKADEILAQAEIEAIKLPTEKGIEAGLLADRVSEKVDQTINRLDISLNSTFQNIQQNFLNSLRSNQEKYDQFLKDLEQRSGNFEAALEGKINQKVESLLLDFEQKVSDFFAGAQQKSLEAINLEITSARQLIDSYKSQQLSIVDENIVAVLEQTLNLVLEKKLTLKDQIDLVYEALEKAKLEKFLV